jgi:tRNA-dihydrouridine synthase B
MLEQTGVDAVMVARGAMGNPLIFSRINHLLEQGRNSPEPTEAEKLSVFLRFAQLYKEQPRQSITEFRQHAIWFTTGFRNATYMRDALGRAQSYEEVMGLFAEPITTRKLH